MNRNAAERHVLAEIFAALGERDAKRARGDLGVLEKHLVEIAHPVEQQAIRIGNFYFDVLRHRRRHAAFVSRRIRFGKPIDCVCAMGAEVSRWASRFYDGHARWMRHARLYAGHPRLSLHSELNVREDVDGRDKPGHD
jgi:hypothetical protein